MKRFTSWITFLIFGLACVLFASIAGAQNPLGDLPADDVALYSQLFVDLKNSVGAAWATGILAVVVSVLGVISRYAVQLLKTATLQKWFKYSWDGLHNIKKMIIAFAASFIASLTAAILTGLAAGLAFKVALWGGLPYAVSAGVIAGMVAIGYQGAIKGILERKTTVNP